jgi:2'-5' RNA ligase
MVDMYFIALVLPEGLNKKVLAYKEWMYEKHTCKVALKSPAHITLIPPFWMQTDRENLLIQSIKNITANQHSFMMQTAGFAAFKPRTLFIATVPNTDLDLLKRETEREFTNHLDPGIKKENRPFHPHITIATRDLHKASFYEAWDHLKELPFEEEWLADSISILKHNKKNWDVYHTSQFNK